MKFGEIAPEKDIKIQNIIANYIIFYYTTNFTHIIYIVFIIIIIFIINILFIYTNINLLGFFIILNFKRFSFNIILI